VAKHIYHRWFIVLGLIAMFGAIITVPLTATYAIAKAGAVPTADTMNDMPCHKTTKHCPDCPQKVCPDLGTCLMKCFQSLYQPAAVSQVRGSTVAERVLPAPPEVISDSLIPPLLRPPSV
jgi:hypothetical protein